MNYDENVRYIFILIKALAPGWDSAASMQGEILMHAEPRAVIVNPCNFAYIVLYILHVLD